MKSPWQFISDLANRRRQRLAEQSSDPTADDGSDRLLLRAPSNRSEVETPLGTETSPAEPIGDIQEDDQTTSAVLETSSATQTATVPKTKTRVARTAKPASRHKPDVTPASDRMPENLPVEPTFHDDVRSVDDDIKLLRTELAEKLRLQNAQLKKMLERFDRQ